MGGRQIRIRTLAAGLAAASILLGSAAAANASAVRWTDPTGDAHYRSAETGGIDALSEPAWDIVDAAVSSGEGRLRWELRLLDMAAPRPAYVSNVWFAFNFEVGPDRFQFSVDEPDDAGHMTVSFRSFGSAPAGPTYPLPCPDCRAVQSPSRHAVVLSISHETLLRGIGRGPSGIRLREGDELHGVSVGAGPVYEYPVLDGRFMAVVHDTAPAPSPVRI